MTTTSISELVEQLGEALFRLSDRLRVSRFVDVPGNHLAYEAVVAAYQALTRRSIPTAAPDDAAVERVADLCPLDWVDGLKWHELGHRAVLASVQLGGWLSAALDDPKVCDAMKADIREWFSAGEPMEILGQAATHFAALTASIPPTTAPECPSCHGLNISCPEGCQRDPATGELTTTAPGEVVQADREAAAKALGYKTVGDATDYRNTGAEDRAFEAMVKQFRDHRLAFSHPSCEVERLRKVLDNTRHIVARCAASGFTEKAALEELYTNNATISEAIRSTPETVSLKGDRV